MADRFKERAVARAWNGQSSLTVGSGPINKLHTLFRDGGVTRDPINLPDSI
jgi:hypothetical protein